MDSIKFQAKAHSSVPDFNSMVSTDAERVALVIPTLNAGYRWRTCLAAVLQQTIPLHRRLIIDSSSTDGTAEQAAAVGFEIRKIPRSDFNHGGTRQLAVDQLTDCEIMIFLTQDAILANPHALAKLVGCLEDHRVALAYGRQLPHKDAGYMEAHARIFNYGEKTLRKDLKARVELGAKVFFCSNSFAAYRRSVLLELGGFRSDSIIGEDAEFAARAVLAGYSNVYCADAEVYHSHDYSIAKVFCRYFDTGVFHARNSWMSDKFGSHGGEGWRYVRSELRYLALRAPQEVPRCIAHTFAKVAAYRLGKLERLLPRTVKRRLSMNTGFWRS